MIYINKAKNAVKPDILEYSDANFVTKTKKLILQKRLNKNNILYKHKNVKNELFRLYNNKCAFCEGKIDLAQNPIEIEHYRPKNEIKNKKTEGYYWLGYEWTNLLPICKMCNSNKSSHFPIINTARNFNDLENSAIINSEINQKAFDISELNKIEEPYILNPDIDKVEDYFLFLPNGKIKAINNSEKAKKTIDILKLNRAGLIDSRKKYIDEIFMELVNKFIEAKNENELIILLNDRFRNIQRLQNENKKYSRLAYFMFFLFEKFIIERFKNKKLDKHADILEKVYESYITENQNS